MDFTLYVGSFFFPCYLVNTIEIFMRKNNVQMEVVPVDVNLGGHRSALICFSLQIVIFILCTLKVFYSYHSSFSVTTSGNGDFGDWSAFNQAPSGSVASGGELFGSTSQPAVELVSGSQPALGPPPAASNPSDLFDLMGSSQATMTSSQSMNFSMMSTNTVGLGLPMSRSQVSCLPPLEIVIHNLGDPLTNLR